MSKSELKTYDVYRGVVIRLRNACISGVTTLLQRWARTGLCVCTAKVGVMESVTAMMGRMNQTTCVSVK